MLDRDPVCFLSHNHQSLIVKDEIKGELPTLP